MKNNAFPCNVTIAICDDETLQIAYERKMVEAWAASRSIRVSIQDFISAEAYLFENIPFDILLLDIQMGGATGMELAQKLRENDRHAQIIFITAYADFMADGYDVDAVNYLMKPVNEDKFFHALDKATARLTKTELSLLLPVDGETVRVPAKDIILVESFAHEQEITVAGGRVIRVKMPIYALEEQLGEGFIRCHRSYIVGLGHVQKITKNEVVLSEGKAALLSRRLYETVNKALMQYFMEGTH